MISNRYAEQKTNFIKKHTHKDRENDEDNKTMEKKARKFN